MDCRPFLSIRIWATLVYLLVDVAVAVLTQAFWEIAGTAFNAQQAKR